ncbi:helix-turn-helix domain-containing protein [Streptomyces uncialis]|uniref:helix-turn-helix domain-containing protein n=1 Tax=Streptomyces uncialis TaxID=1048205 RepID=UPI0037A21A0A|nr:helix-turn-helix domain-containing protein [Streptomyces uncialis]
MDSGTTDAAEAAGAGDEDGWEVDPEDEIAPVVEMAGNQMRAWREGAGLRAADFGARIGYGEDLVRKVERGARIPRPEYLDKADAVLGAGGKISALKKDLTEARYPKKIRKLAKLEAQAVELLSYGSHGLHGTLQTEQYARALIAMRQPAYPHEEVERGVAARLARHAIFGRSPAPTLSFVLEEVTLKRPLGGRLVLRQQLERLLEVGELRSVSIQVMPTGTEEHAGVDGSIQVLKFPDGSAVGRSEGAYSGRPVSDPKQLRILELRYGMIRSQALKPRESMDYIRDLLGVT